MSFPYRSTAGYLVLLAVSVVVAQSLIRQSAKVRVLREDNERKRTKLEEARKSMAGQERVLADISNALSEIAKFDADSVASGLDPTSWAYDQMRSCAAEAGLKLVNVSDANRGIPDPKIRDESPWLKPYRLSVEFTGTPVEAARFVRCMEDSNSQVVMHHFSIVALRKDEPPMIFVTMEWPAWSDEATRERAEVLLKQARSAK